MAVTIEDICRRFLGVDIQRRREGTGWFYAWRVRLLTSKNESASYRITAYGSTMTEACELLCFAVRAVDDGETVVSPISPATRITVTVSGQ